MMQDPSSPDQAQFTGESLRPGLSRELKMKLALVLGAIACVLAAAAYVRYRVASLDLGGKATATVANPDAPGQRKSKVFDTDNLPAAKAPIILPLEQAPASAASMALPSGFAGGFPATGAGNEGLPTPKPAPPVAKSMMLGDDAPTSSPQPGVVLPAAKPVAPTTASKGLDLAALLGLASGGKGGGSETPSALAEKSLNNMAPSPSTAGLGNSNGKTAFPTVEAQAQIAREKAGSQVTGTAQVSASKLGRRSFVLAKGAFIPCVLETQLVSNVFGMTSCVVTQNVYSDDGKVLLIERGSRVTGNYGSNLRNGDSRLAVVWDRIKTPKGITVDVNSPATDGVGAMGMPGVVDKHWFERIAGAIMLSLIQDTIQYATSSIAYRSYLKEQKDIANTQLPVQMANTSNSTVTTTSVNPETGDTITTVSQSGQSPVAQAARSSNGNPPPVPVFGGNNTTKQGASIPEQVLAASINATPTLYKNRGDVVYIFVANDLWFDRVYGLKE